MGKRSGMSGIYDDHGIRFEYPDDWEVEVTDDGPRVTASVQSPGGLAFALVTVDEDRPSPAELADEALAALKDEYPTLDAFPALETIDGHKAVGHDVEFTSLDLNNACVIRSFRTPSGPTSKARRPRTRSKPSAARSKRPTPDTGSAASLVGWAPPTDH
jgi:hypothetical protein